MEFKHCPNYCGLSCVNGSCPNALAYEYSDYGYEHCTCEECWFYRGCEDCCVDCCDEELKKIYEKE